ncbi:MAG: ADP-ribosylglycohydrolase family protein [Acutalibacteraceae bacterium]|nr:ADP-ribosylglycohydrolase family protein [Acutalibacteraceae bacterium]
MLGAIIGDIIGSVYEWDPIKTEDFPLFCSKSRFTDDTVLTVATAQTLLELAGKQEMDERSIAKAYAQNYRAYYRRYPLAGFGGMFADWAQKEPMLIQGSYGNGAAMRVCPIGYAFDDMESVLLHTEKSCLYTHNNAEAIKGAKAVAGAVFLARNGKKKADIRRFVQHMAGYDLNFRLEDIRPGYTFSSRTKLSVPEAISAFLQAESFEDTLRKAVSLGGDSDTIACIAGGIAYAFYKQIPKEIEKQAMRRLDQRLLQTVTAFMQRYHPQ